MIEQVNIQTDDKLQCRLKCYMVVKLIGNKVEIYHVNAETANVAIIKAKHLTKPLRSYQSDSNYYGEGIFAIVENEVCYTTMDELIQLFQRITPQYEQYYS